MIVVNIVIHGNSFIGIDGNGIVVLKGSFDYFKDMEIWHGDFQLGPRGRVNNYRVNKNRAEYFENKKALDDKYLREMFGLENGLIANKIINF